MSARLLFVLIVTVLLPLGPALAQSVFPDPPGSTEDAPATDPLGRDTPRGMVDGLISALGSNDYARAADFLDLSNVPAPGRDRAGLQRATSLQSALDLSGGILPTYRLSTDPSGLADDTLPPNTDQFGIVRVDGALRDLLAHRVDDLNGNAIWLVTPETLDFLANLSGISQTGLVDRFTPSGLRGSRAFGAPIAHWVAIAAIVAVALLLARSVARIVLFILQTASRRLRSGYGSELTQEILRPLSLLMACMLYFALIPIASVSVVARARTGPIVEVLAWLAVGWLLWRLVDVAASLILQSVSRRGRRGSIAITTLMRRAIKGIIVGVLAIAAANALGLNLTGWLAALGLGGLAFALGAQKTIENFVGSLSLIADQPVRVGDYCTVDGISGTVEDIGVRSTRLRTLDRTLVTIPNGTVSQAQIENYTSRDRFLYNPTLGLLYETNSDQLRQVLTRLRALLADDNRLTPEDTRVRFRTFGSSSLDVEVFAYVQAPDFIDFLEVQEDLNLKIMDLVQDCGTGFAFPSRTVYIQDERSTESS